MRAFLLLAALALAAVLWVRHLERTRPQDVPWTPLDLRQPIGLATQYKLQRLTADPAACRAALSRAGVGFTAIADTAVSPGCGYRNAVVLTRSSLRYAPTPVRLSCPLAAALVIWERQSVIPAARRLGGEAVAVSHYGTFNCRRIAGRSSGAFSEHATANAIDIAAIRLADGREIGVARDWWGRDPRRAAFLHLIHTDACRLFGTVLGPDYNAAHASHFHLDMKGWSACR